MYQGKNAPAEPSRAGLCPTPRTGAQCAPGRTSLGALSPPLAHKAKRIRAEAYGDESRRPSVPWVVTPAHFSPFSRRSMTILDASGCATAGVANAEVFEVVAEHETMTTRFY